MFMWFKMSSSFHMIFLKENQFSKIDFQSITNDYLMQHKRILDIKFNKEACQFSKISLSLLHYQKTLQVFCLQPVCSVSQQLCWKPLDEMCLLQSFYLHPQEKCLILRKPHQCGAGSCIFYTTCDRNARSLIRRDYIEKLF